MRAQTSVLGVMALLFLIIAVVGLAATFLNNYLTSVTSKVFLIKEASCTDRANIALVNTGTATLELSKQKDIDEHYVCQTDPSDSNIQTCGDITVTKKSGPNAPEFYSIRESFKSEEEATLIDNGCVIGDGLCEYIISTTSKTDRTVVLC